MQKPVPLRIYLDRASLAQAEAGKHNFLNRVARAVEGPLRCEHQLWSEAVALRAVARRGYALMHMKAPPNGRSLVFRQAYIPPYWRIERSEKRWEWDVARAGFDAGAVDPGTAQKFADRIRARLFAGLTVRPRSEGHALIPLQGRLRERRSFQHAAPLAMIDAALEHLPGHTIVATLHPKETHDAGDLAALDALVRRFPRLRVQSGGSDALLPGAEVIICENSSVGFKALFLGKPVVLFAEIDFHHVARRVAVLGAEAAIRGAEPSDNDRYLWWFLEGMAINAMRPDAEPVIRARLAELGWPV